MKKIIALAMACTMLLALAGCGKSAAVKETERLISDIGTVTVDSAGAVEAAEAAYQALSQEEQEQLSNYDVLTAAREALDAAQLEALQHALVGTWRAEVDMKDALAEEINTQFSDLEISFGDYLEHFELVMRLELNQDGTYHLSPDTAGMESSLQSFRDAMTPFIRGYLQHYIANALKESGIEGDFSTLEGLEEAIGTDLDSAIEQSLGVSLEDYVDTLMEEMNVENLFAGAVAEGSYTVEPGKLLFSDKSEPAEFTLEGDTLTLHVPDSDTLLGLTELTFTRAS